MLIHQFPGQSVYDSKNRFLKRGILLKREFINSINERGEKRFLLWCENNRIVYENDRIMRKFYEFFKENLDGEWIPIEKDNFMLLFKIDDSKNFKQFNNKWKFL